MDFNYQEFVDLLNSAIMKAEDDVNLHFLIIETFMSSVAKICKMTLDSNRFEPSTKTKEIVSDLMVELVSAMLRDYLKEGN